MCVSTYWEVQYFNDLSEMHLQEGVIVGLVFKNGNSLSVLI